MFEVLKKMFEPKASTSDMVKYIRTEFASDTKHLKDDDAIQFYNYYINSRRNKNVS